jgi:DNA-binding CsgD family transcriptional regulator
VVGQHGHPSPFVGRDAEASVLAIALRTATRGAFRCIVIDGEPGVGKTRLATDLLARSRGRFLPLRARGHLSGSASPFGLWAELFDSHLRQRPDDEVVRLCGGYVADLSGILRAAARLHGSWRLDVPPTHVREALTVVLANLAREEPVVVLLDDMHLADASSWETLDYIARNMTDNQVLVLVCARLGEMAERAIGEHVLFGLEQDGVLTRLDLQPLKEPPVRELAERVLGRPSAPPGLAAWLFRESRGNPLFAVSLLDAVLDAGIDLTAPRLAAIPQALSARVAQRLQVLDEHSQSVLDLLAVVGRPTDLEELRRIHSSRAGQSVPVAIGRLVDARLVVARDADGDPAYEVSHPLVQECIYTGLDPVRRRALHHQVALALEASDRLGEAARHHARSAQRGDVEAVAVLSRALAESWTRQTYAEAFVILGSLLDVLASGDRRWVDVLDAMPPDAGWAASYNRIAFDIRPGVAALSEIERVLLDQQRVIDATVDSRAQRRLALVSSYLAGLLGWCLGEVDDAAARAARAADLYERAGDLAQARAARCDLAWFEGLARRYGAQEALTRQVLIAAEAANDPENTVVALSSLFAAATVRGDFDGAWSASRRLVETAKACGNPSRVAFGLAIQAQSLALAGELDDARRALDDALTVERAFDNIVAETEIVVAWEAGKFLRVARDGPGVAARSGPTQQAGLLSYVAMAAAEVGDLAAAHRHLETAGRMLPHQRFWITSDHYDRACGRVAWVAEDHDTSVERLGRAAAEFLDAGALPYASHVLADLAEAAWVAVMPKVAADAARAAEDVARQLGRPHFAALAALAGAAAALAVGRYDEGAEAALEAAQLFLGRGYQALGARSLALLGRCLVTQDRKAAVERLREAVEVFGMCGCRWRRDQALETLRHLGKPGQRAAAASTGPGSLTGREREITALAVQGMSARAIGELLHIGERTVESHLARVYLKFGVHSREQLADAIALHAS